MDKSNVEMFLEELNALQDKYGIYIDAEYDENWDYGWDGENEYRYVSGVEACVIFMNKGGYEIQDIYRDVDWHYHMLHMVCD